MSQKETEEKAIQLGVPATIARLYSYEIHSLVLDAKCVPKSIVKLVEEVEYLLGASSALSATQATIFKNLKKLVKEVRHETGDS